MRFRIPATSSQSSAGLLDSVRSMFSSGRRRGQGSAGHDSKRVVAALCSLAGFLSTAGLQADEKPVSILAAKVGGHIHPSICRTSEGTLIVIYKGANVLMCARSTDGGETWAKPEPIATSAKRPNVIREVNKFEVYPGTVDVLPDNRILVTWNYIADDKANDGYYERALLYSISSDEGLTWTGQKLIGPVEGKHLGAVRHNVLPWADDCWLLPMRTGPPRLFDPKNGELTVFPVIGPDDKQHEFQQIILTANRELLAMGPVLLRVKDEGRNWIPVENFPAVPDKRDNAEGRHLTALSDGRVLVTWGIGHENKGLRYNLSSDGGKTWDKDETVILLPETKIAARYYSARTVQLDEEHVGTVFMNGDGVHFLKVNLDRFQASRKEDHGSLKNGTRQLGRKLAVLDIESSDLLADAEVFHKGAAWALRYEEPLSEKDTKLLNRALIRGSERVQLLKEKKAPWIGKKGKVLRGFVSDTDGSTQPYGVIVPRGYDGTRPMRLDVVLHGSSKPVGMSEIRFGARFDGGDEKGEDSPSAPDVDYIELHPLGRVENCYRWAGETDVFEAIEAVCRNYRIDRDRIVLRGMSMGASGTWHLGLKHPDRFIAIGPYCGYVDTHRFSETPIPKFIKVGPLPLHQERGLHMLDSIDYAANASVVPAIAAIGDKDIFFQAHVIMGEAFSREGLEMVNLISPGTGHTIDPVTHAEQMRRIGVHAAEGLNHDPDQLRFVTWTLKYNRCHWLELLGLGRHYDRAEFRGKTSEDGAVEISEVKNITRFAIHRPVTSMRILDVDISLPSHEADGALVFIKADGAWRCEGPRSQIVPTGKRPGLQGPIDDAFATPFLCVRGTGKPWNPEVDAWASASLRRFEYEWARYMRGDLPIKNDTEVTEADVREKHLILFGDPGSNSWIAKALPELPVTWSRDKVQMGNDIHPAKNHAPSFICPSPLARDRYLVINSGHTFHEKEFAAFNYLLFPRLGDWAVMQALPGSSQWKPSSADFPENVIRAGYFDEAWRAPERDQP